MQRVAIVDTGLSNLHSVRRAVEECGGAPFFTDAPGALEAATHVILPGVGTFREAMERLRRRGLVAALAEQVLGRGIPFLGICLGMQLLATRGDEGGDTPGLGWIPGVVRRLEVAPPLRLPHLGWDCVEPCRPSPLFAGLPAGGDYYFVHSYHLDAEGGADVLARTSYGVSFASAVGRAQIHGVQFHPEKSQRLGLRLLRNFLAMTPC